MSRKPLIISTNQLTLWLLVSLGAVLLGTVASGGEPVPAGPLPATPPTAGGEGVAPAPEAPPAAGYDWDELGRRAAANCDAAEVLLLEAQADRCEADVAGGYRSPQLRFGRQWEDGSSDRTAVGLRVYTVNPFVSRWLRRRGTAEAQAREAQAQEEGYAVFCEVRSLCLEAELLREDVALLEEMLAIRTQMRDLRAEEAGAGVSSPVDEIRAETRMASLRSQVRAQEAARSRLVRRIALATGIPPAQLRLRRRPPGLPIAECYLDPTALTDLAFLRRPDLAQVEHEKEAAEHAVEAARARRLPWVEYVEGGYGDGHPGDEWQLRAAVAVPVFDWLGGEVRLSQARLAAAKARVRGSYASVSAEVTGVLEDYQAAARDHERLASEGNDLVSRLSARIDALAREPTIRRAEVLQARDDLVAYRRTTLEGEREWLRLAQHLETLSGGSLAPGGGNAAVSGSAGAAAASRRAVAPQSTPRRP